MNEEYLNGLQDASIDVLEMGCVFVEELIKEMSDSPYRDGYLKGYNLMLERKKLLFCSFWESNSPLTSLWKLRRNTLTGVRVWKI